MIASTAHDRDAPGAAGMLQRNEKLSENGVMASRTMNTLLHVIEAYAELYRVWPDESLKMAATAALKQCLNTVYNPLKHRLEVFFDRDFHPLLDMQSYGHDIESSCDCYKVRWYILYIYIY